MAKSFDFNFQNQAVESHDSEINTNFLSSCRLMFNQLKLAEEVHERAVDLPAARLSGRHTGRKRRQI